MSPPPSIIFSNKTLLETESGLSLLMVAQGCRRGCDGAPAEDKCMMQPRQHSSAQDKECSMCACHTTF